MTPPPVCKLWYQRRQARQQRAVDKGAGGQLMFTSLCCEFNFSRAERFRVSSVCLSASNYESLNLRGPESGQLILTSHISCSSPTPVVYWISAGQKTWCLISTPCFTWNCSNWGQESSIMPPLSSCSSSVLAGSVSAVVLTKGLKRTGWPFRFWEFSCCHSQC